MTEKVPVSKILVENSEGEFLVLQKSDSYEWEAGKWELPGGKIDNNKGEDREDTALRELEDETGLEAENFIDVVRVEVEDFNENPVVNCWILHTDSFKGEIELSEEHQSFRWVKPREFRYMDWHRDAGYGLPPMVYLEEYLS